MQTTNKVREGNRIATAIMYVLAVFVVFITLYPMYYVLILSLSEARFAATMEVYTIPKGFNLDAYRILVMDPKIWRFFSNTVMYAGTVLSFTDADKDPWEGGQGADSFYLYPVKDRWRAFYGSYGTSYQWCVGLACADRMAGPWRRDDEREPAFDYAENPIVLPLADGGYLCVYDDLAHGISDCSSIGYGYSADGIVWEKGFVFLERPRWAACIRTPQSLIPIGGGEYWVYFSAVAKAGFDSIGRLRVKVSQ
jgi:hypothetical protein